jgi:hypothetical protein
MSHIFIFYTFVWLVGKIHFLIKRRAAGNSKALSCPSIQATGNNFISLTPNSIFETSKWQPALLISIAYSLTFAIFNNEMGFNISPIRCSIGFFDIKFQVTDLIIIIT